MSPRVRWTVGWLGIMAGLQFIAGSSSLTNLVAPSVAAWVQLVVGALEAATAIVYGKSGLALLSTPDYPESSLTATQRGLEAENSDRTATTEFPDA